MQKSKLPGARLLSVQDAAIAKMIAVRSRRGESLEHIARTSKIPYARVRKIAVAAQIRYKHRRPSKEQIQAAIAAVRDKGGTFRASAKATGLSRTAVHRYVARRRQESIDAAGELVVEDGTREFSKHKRSWMCPTHGRVTVWPCVACAALELRRRKT